MKTISKGYPLTLGQQAQLLSLAPVSLVNCDSKTRTVTCTDGEQLTSKRFNTRFSTLAYVDTFLGPWFITAIDGKLTKQAPQNILLLLPNFNKSFFS